jgi:hypothetical protein
MKAFRHSLVFMALVLTSMGVVAVQSPTQLRLTQAEMEAFLLKASISHRRDAGAGVTGSSRVTLSDGRVPMSVERNIEGKSAAVTWWVDDVMMDEKARLQKKTVGPDPQRFGQQMQVMKIWDELIQNMDRNQGNLLWTSDWTLWLIDHTRAFRLDKKLQNPGDLTRCDRSLLDGLRRLTPESLALAVGNSLTRAEQDAVMARRDLLVHHFEDRITKLGQTILF